MDSYLIAAYSLTAFLAATGTVLKVAIGLGFVIFVHELGHFLAAKACGVKCEKFYVGFDIPMKFGPIRLPSTLGKFQWGETEYGIGILPLGGYVKMLGQDDNPMNAEKEAERIRLAQDGDIDSGSQPEAPPEFDPRSFPAKPVWQRLIIISAGVIMNLIFAVIFAAVAYKSGLEYIPCEIDGTAAGDPAWIVGLEAGDKIVQIGKDTDKDEHMRFDWELREKVITAGVGSSVRQMDLLIRRNGEEKWYQITPTSRAKKLRKTVSLGVLQPRSTRINSLRPTMAHTSAAEVEGLGGKRVVAINGIPLPRDEETEEIFSYHLSKHLVLHVSEPVTLTLEDTDPKNKTTPPTTTTVTVPPNPMKTLGIVMKVGPVTAVQKGSHAEAAGIQQGDILSKVDGQPIGDPLTLEQRLQKKRNNEVTIVVLRDGQPVSIKVKVGSPQGISDYSYASPAALTSIGIAFRVEPKVASVELGSAAAEQGIKAGDVVTSVAFDLIDSEDKQLRKQVKTRFGKRFDVPIGIGEDESSWPHIHRNMQSILPGMHLVVAIKRGDESETKNLVPANSKQYYLSERGIVFVPFSRVHTADNWSEAFKLGFRETKEKLFSVIWVLQKLLTGQISVTNLGGPVLIAYVAGSEANRGIARLLVFLTMLSANLAVLNFLPIPALDGGHAVFLCWEGVTGKPASERIQGTLTLIGVALLLCLMLAVLVMDIGRLLP